MILYSIKDCLYKIAYRNEYDLMAGDIVREIFSNIKGGLNSFTISKPNLDIKVNVVNKDIAETTYKNFHITAYSDIPVISNNDNAPLDTPTITVNLYINAMFSAKDYNDLNYSLYSVIRHEIEHYHNYVLKKQPESDYVERYTALMNSNNNNLERHVQMVSDYILCESEIDAYARSIIYVAKKQNKAPFEIIDQIFKRAFFNNNRELLLIGQHSEKIREIIENTRNKLMQRIGSFYPGVKEAYL